MVYSDPTGEIAPAVVAGAGVATAGIRLCAANPACRYLAKEAIRWGAKSLITHPIFNDRSDDDCRDENVEINDASSHNIIGGAPNPPDPDDQDNGEDKPKDLKKVDDNYLKQRGHNAHEIKKEFLGRNAEIKRYDIYVDKKSGKLWILRKKGNKGSKESGIPTGYIL
ncbi:polymorphic toxin type 33 domain-containing protein [Snodgrassella sp.]|uniref:polymorphic toxin type 33 domain-containing protein n=1 Tax=Snodgrassella sp. TaxID=2815304 RepID=UPI0033904D5B